MSCWIELPRLSRVQFVVDNWMVEEGRPTSPKLAEIGRFLTTSEITTSADEHFLIIGDLGVLGAMLACKLNNLGGFRIFVW